MDTTLITLIDQTTGDLLQTIDLFTQEQFNVVPFEGSWTGGQLCDHLRKSETGIPQVWKGHTTITQRDVNVNTPIIEKIFLDFTIKMKSPPELVPSDEKQDKQSLYNILKSNREEIRKMATTIDLTLTYTDFDMPQMGPLTGIEWVHFLYCHSTRHIRQLKNIYAALQKAGQS